MTITNLLISALSQGMIYVPMALGVFIAFRVLNMPDLTIDGSFVFGMCVCAVVTIAGQPALALLCGALAGALAGLCTGLLQTKLRINPILSGILTMTGLYTINFIVLGGQSNLYLQKTVLNSAGAETQVASDTLYTRPASHDLSRRAKASFASRTKSAAESSPMPCMRR